MRGIWTQEPEHLKQKEFLRVCWCLGLPKPARSGSAAELFILKHITMYVHMPPCSRQHIRYEVLLSLRKNHDMR